MTHRGRNNGIVIGLFCLAGMAIATHSTGSGLTDSHLSKLKVASVQVVDKSSDPSVVQSRKQALLVVQVTPSSEHVADAKQVTITFNKPMVPLGDFEVLANDLPVAISPSVDCQWQWLNRQTLACSLSEALPDSNAFTVTVSKGFTAYDDTVLAQDYTAEFSTLPWKVLYARLIWKAADQPEQFLFFNQAMNMDQLANHVSSTCGQPSVKKATQVELEQWGSAEEINLDTVAKIYFSDPLGLDRACKVTVDQSAPAASGTLPSVKNHVASFQTYPEFSVSDVRCSREGFIEAYDGGDTLTTSECNPDVYGITLKFSSPVLGKDLASFLKVDPKLAREDGYGSVAYYQNNPDRAYTSIVVYGPLQAQARYEINVKGLQDQFGRPLKNAHRLVVQTMDHRPLIDTPYGFGVLEKKGPWQLPYTTTNVAKLELAYAQGNDVDQLDLWKMHEDSRDVCLGKYKGIKRSLKHKQLPGGKKINQPEVLPLELSSLTPGWTHGMLLGIVDSVTPVDGIHYYDPYKERFDKVCDSFFTVVTDLGIMAKVGYFDSGIWIHSIADGKPLSGVSVQLRTYKTIHAKGVTNDQGYVALAGAQSWNKVRNYEYADNTLFVVAKTNDDFSVLPFDQGKRGLYAGEFDGVYNNNLSADNNQIVHAITDRALYQVNQTVHMKIFARHWEPRTFGLKPASTIKLVVFDAKDEKVHQADLALSDYGTVADEFMLPADAALGIYRMATETTKENYQTIGYFDVQAFTLPSFKVNVIANAEKQIAGQKASFDVEASYYFGGALAQAKGHYYATFKERSWHATKPAWSTFDFNHAISLTLPGSDQTRREKTVYLVDGESVVLNKEGKKQVSIQLPTQDIRANGVVTLESQFSDDRGKSIASRASTDVFFADVLLGMKKDQWAYAKGEKIPLSLIVLNTNEQPVAGKKINVQLIQRNYISARVKGVGNHYGHETKTQDVVVDTCQTTSGTQAVSCTVIPKKGGQHYLLASTMDGQQRKVESSMQVYVTGPEYVGWNQGDHDRIDIVPDKASYAVGENISLLVKNPYQSVDAIVTLERFGILKQFRKKLTGGAQIITIPVDQKDYAPGFYVSVQLIQGRVSEKIENNIDLGKPSFKMGMAKIKVVNPDTLLEVSAVTDRKEYEPGDTVKVALETSAQSGKKQVELSVAVVDEKILRLIGTYQNKFELHDLFYNMRGADVETSQMLTALIGRRHYGRKGLAEGGDGDTNSDLAARSDFLPLAYWNPSVETNAQGKASVSFTLPDNLTTWKILVVAIDKEHRFGFGTGSMIASKKIMIEPALPSFLTEGDQLDGRVVVFNRTEKNDTINASLLVEGATLQGPAAFSSIINRDQKHAFTWPLTVPVGIDRVSLDISASNSQKTHGDRMTHVIPVKPFAAFDTFAHYGSTLVTQTSIPLALPQGIRKDLGGLELVVSSSLVSQLDQAIMYGINYPYTCWEQTLVKALMLTYSQSLKDYVTLPEMPKAPNDWAQSLLSTMGKYQATNGGMGYWKSDVRSVSPYLSIMTSMAMHWLQDQGVAVPQANANKVHAYVDRLLRGQESWPDWYQPEEKASMEAMAVYAMALQNKADGATINRLLEDKTSMDLWGQSFLWSAAHKFGSDEKVTSTIKNQLMGHISMTSGKVQFQDVAHVNAKRYLHSDTRTNCRVLSSLLEVEPDHAFVEPLVRHIMDAQKVSRWNNTQENLYCLQALVAYTRAYEKEVPDFTLKSTVVDTALPPMTFKGYKSKPIISTVPMQKIAQGASTSVELNKQGPGRMYYATRLKMVYQDMTPKEVARGMALSRTYYTLNAQNQWEKQTQAMQIKRGDIVRVELTATVPAMRYHVTLADHLPGSLEPLNTALATTSQAALSLLHGVEDIFSSQADPDAWWSYYTYGGFYHREMPLEGALYFADKLLPGTYTMNYLAQAIATGTFNAAPAIIEEMYSPEVYGRSTATTFTVAQ